ncbi:hypothetical protein J2799_000663 [Chryseobacterium vietnamense]|nr:hypothetical protein [Chryseobacterium vietnamense]
MRLLISGDEVFQKQNKKPSAELKVYFYIILLILVA